MKIIKGTELASKTLEVQANGTLRIVRKGKFIPKIGEVYWYIDNFGRICHVRFENDEADKWILKHHLVFETEAECLEYKAFLGLLDEYEFEPDWNNMHEDKLLIILNRVSKKLEIHIRISFQMGNSPLFETREKVLEFIGKAGEENIKKFMFDVRE